MFEQFDHGKIKLAFILEQNRNFNSFLKFRRMTERAIDLYSIQKRIQSARNKGANHVNGLLLLWQRRFRRRRNKVVRIGPNVDFQVFARHVHPQTLHEHTSSKTLHQSVKFAHCCRSTVRFIFVDS